MTACMGVAGMEYVYKEAIVIASLDGAVPAALKLSATTLLTVLVTVIVSLPMSVTAWSVGVGLPALLISAPFIGRVRRVQNILVVVGAILPRNVRLAVDSVPTIRAQHRSVNLGCTIRALLLL